MYKNTFKVQFYARLNKNTIVNEVATALNLN